MRHFPEITDVQPRKDNGRPKPTAHGSNVYLRSRLGHLAFAAGFDSEEISQLQKLHPDMQMAREFLLRVRPQEDYLYEETYLNSIIQQICHLISEAPPRQKQLEPPIYSSDLQSPLEIQYRCGRPSDQAFKENRKYLFLQWLQNKDSGGVRRRNMTSFAVQSEFFHAFFQSTTDYEGDDIAMGRDFSPPAKVGIKNVGSFAANPMARVNPHSNIAPFLAPIPPNTSIGQLQGGNFDTNLEDPLQLSNFDTNLEHLMQLSNLDTNLENPMQPRIPDTNLEDPLQLSISLPVRSLLLKFLNSFHPFIPFPGLGGKL
ncbi:MAG: hypothetical protein MMC33_010726 [Icmadophila ericetorum]|nr:hypothetical protein [Icmadophila ericetorum]